MSLREQFEALVELDAVHRGLLLANLAAFDPQRAARLRVMLLADLQPEASLPVPPIVQALVSSCCGPESPRCGPCQSQHQIESEG